MTQSAEGAFKFSLEFTEADVIQPAWMVQFNSWRTIHQRLQLVHAFGEPSEKNFTSISMRQQGEPENFVITGAESLSTKGLTPADVALVTACDFNQGKLTASGQSQPSPDALLHAKLYQLSHDIQCVIHANCADIWQLREALKIPNATCDDSKETSHRLIDSIEHLFEQTSVNRKRIFTLDTHEGSVFGFGRNFFEASVVLIDHLVRAIEHQEFAELN